MRGSTGTTVNVRGTYFYEISAVRFGAATAASFRIETPELIIAQVGQGETGLVSVVGSQGIAKSTEEFEFVRSLSLPIITEFTPTSGGRGLEVEITGRNVGGAVAVRFGGVEAQFTVISDTRISATVQGGASGQVQVTTPNGTATSLERFQFISDTMRAVAQTPRQQDSSILVRLYATMTGQQWLRQRAWLSDMPISSWAGVSVEHDRVVGLLLPSNNLRGNLPAFLGQLTDIEILDMSFNELSGEIPAAITSLPKLRILELNNNQLSGVYPSNFGTTATLQILHLQHNVLTGSLNNVSAVAVYDPVTNTIISSTTANAATTCGLRNLRELNVSANHLTGIIPPCIGNLTALTMLNLSGNALEDTIPASLSACVNLREIYLSSNMLRGSIAPLFQGASELRVIDVSDNLLTGLPVGLPTGVPTGRVAPVQLETLLLQKNQFSGVVPQFLTNLTTLRVLNMSDNSFSSALPSELNSLKHLQTFSVANNRLQGVIPSALGEMDSLRVLNLSNNAFADSVPASIGTLRQLERLVLAHNRLTWLPNLRALRLLKELNVAENRLTFEHCEPNVIVPVHIYAPQDSIGEPSTATLRVGQVAEFPLRIGGETNQYQWFRNGVAVALQRTRSLRFAAFSRNDTGTYSCRITSSDARLSALKLFSRPIEIRVLPPAAPKGTITLLAPKQNAASVQTQNILFSWAALSEASSYEIQIATTPDFVSIVQDSIVNQVGFIAAKLSYLSRYYWRVRGMNEGLSSAWSEVRQFATLGEGDRITLERIDFGGVAVGSISAPKQILLRNATGEPIIITGWRIGDGSESSLSGAVNFRISSQPVLLEGGGTALDSTIGYGFVFAPRSPSTASASLTIRYRLTSGTVEQTQTFSSVMVGFGSILGAAPLDFDSVVVGKGIGRVMELPVTNRAGGVGGILRIEVPEASRLLGFSLNDNIGEYQFKKSGETFSFLIKCSPQQYGELKGSIMLISSLAGDTIFVPLRAFGRSLSRNDALIALSLFAIPKNAPPGSPILIQLRLDTIRIIDGASIINGNFGDLQRRAQPRLSMRLRMNPQVLIFASDETRPVFLHKDREGYNTYSLPTQVWSVQDSTLITLRAIVVAGSTDSTALDCVDVAWDNSNTLLGAEVIIDTLRDGTFRANVSRAGGKRLIAPVLLPFVVTVKPNPSADVAEVVYLLSQEAEVVVEIITMKGEVLQQMIQPKQQIGEHATTLALRQIPSGSYLVRVRAADAIAQQQLTILH
jgi:Leucine-rich repeat (LRR) protein